jgi:hypothetical protein
VELLEQALSLAEQMGYRVRQEWMGGVGGGVCEFGGRKWIFVDLALNVVEQLEQVRLALETDPSLHAVDVSPSMSRWLGVRRAA